MEPLPIAKDLVIPGDSLSVSFTRDLGGEGTPEAARATPTTVELRLSVSGCDAFTPEQKARILAYLARTADRRGTVRVVFGEHRSRRQNLEGARRQLTLAVREALDDSLRPDEPAGPPARQKRGRRGLHKARPDGT